MCVIKLSLNIHATRPIYACGWLTYFDFRESLRSFKENIDCFNEINPFIYAFNREGTIIKADGLSDAEYKNIIKISHENRICVIPTIVNDVISLQQNILKDPGIIHNLLCDDSSIKRHIADIISVIRNDGVDGIEIDYEKINYEDKEQFIKFIKLLSGELHNNNKLLNIVLSADIFYGKKLFFAEEDLSIISGCVDTVKIMCYNLHGPFSQPGPVATVEWIDQVMRVVTKNIPREKICIAIALHGFDWSVGKTYYLTYKEAMELVEGHNSQIKRTNDNIPYFSYIKNRVNHIVWFEDMRSIITKIKTVRRYGVKKIAFWRLGSESEKMYSSIRNN